MGSLQLLSALNWCAVMLYGFVGLVAVYAIPGALGPVGLGVAAVLAAPHVYLALNIEKGRGRWLQTVLAVLLLPSVPIGTIIGLIALYACWVGDTSKLFDDPSAIGAEPRSPDEVVVPPLREGETAYAWARRLKTAGFTGPEIASGLRREGFDEADIETTLGAVQLGTGRRRRAAPAPPIDDVPTSPRARRGPRR
jgi:hypothetical protein